MCGFVGIWDFNGLTSNHNTFIDLAMEDLLRRGPDEGKIWKDENNGVILGFRRLAIRDLSSAGSQPMLSKSGNLTLVFNGEIYNINELIQWAEIELSELTSHSDTEVVLACFEKKGITETVPRLDGIFVMAVYNMTDKILTLIRDYAGVKPLYYGLCSQGLVFSSHYYHITSHNFFRNNAIIPSALRNYFNYGFIQEDEGLIENTFFMPQRHIIEINRNGSIKMTQYKPTLENNSKIDLTNILTDVINSQLVSDVPIGTFMSGGVDSTITTGIASQLKKGIKCYTIGVNDELLDESSEAERFGKYFNVDHKIHQITDEEVIKALDQYEESAGEPLGDFSSLMMLKVCEIAKKELTVVLSGDGGDELFFGYPRFNHANKEFEYLNSTKYKRLFKILLKKTVGHKVPIRLMRFKNFNDYYLYKQSIPGSLIWTERLLKNKNHQLQFWIRTLNIKNYIAKDAMQLARNIEFNIHMQRVLLKVDRASMYHSLEVRTPLLSKKIIEYSNYLQFEDCYEINIGKIPLRKVLQSLIPKDAMNSGKKKGFSPPLAYWLRSTLKDRIGNRILMIPEILKPYINQRTIERIWIQHQEGKDFSWMIWSIYTLFIWVELKMFKIKN